jgi:hypothetical protein
MCIGTVRLFGGQNASVLSVHAWGQGYDYDWRTFAVAVAELPVHQGSRTQGTYSCRKSGTFRSQRPPACQHGKLRLLAEW